MTKDYKESQLKIGRLKRENEAMQKELNLCCSTFLNADQTYKSINKIPIFCNSEIFQYFSEKLNEQNSQLRKECEHLEEKLNNTEQNFIHLSSRNDTEWVESMLTYCK